MVDCLSSACLLGDYLNVFTKRLSDIEPPDHNITDNRNGYPTTRPNGPNRTSMAIRANNSTAGDNRTACLAMSGKMTLLSSCWMTMTSPRAHNASSQP